MIQKEEETLLNIIRRQRQVKIIMAIVITRYGAKDRYPSPCAPNANIGKIETSFCCCYTDLDL